MKAGITLLFIFALLRTVAQSPAFNSVVPLKVLPPPTYLRDVFSSPYETKPHLGIQGSPFLEDRWTLVRLKVEGRKQFIDSFHLKLNIYDNKIHFMSEKGVEMEATLKIEEVTILDTASAYKNKVFLSNFDQESGFFEVVAGADKLKVLKRHRMIILESHPLGMEPQKHFEPSNPELFFCSGTVLYKANKSCTFIRDGFDIDKRVFDYISANNIRCNKEEDMKKLAAFVASLKSSGPEGVH